LKFWEKIEIVNHNYDETSEFLKQNYDEKSKFLGQIVIMMKN